MILTRHIRSAARSGFSLVEVMLATTIAMILLFGALYSTGETVELVREGDVAVNTNMHGRRMLERFLKDCRYSSDLAITGDAATGWTVNVTTTGTLDPGALVYSWTPSSQKFTVTDGATTDVLVEDLRAFEMDVQTSDVGGVVSVTRVTAEWTLGLEDGEWVGRGGPNPERTLEIAGTSWVRQNDD